VRVNVTGVDVATYVSLGGKSGGETQELVAFIVGAALRFQLGDEDRVRPRFAPIFLDEGFVKSDSEFAARAVNAWKGLGFQRIVGAPLDKVTALEPDMDFVLTVTKGPSGYSHVTELRSAGESCRHPNRCSATSSADSATPGTSNGARQPHAGGPPAEPSSWPHSFPLGTVPKAILERDFERFQAEAFVWRDWAAVHRLTHCDTPRVVHGTTQRMLDARHDPGRSRCCRIVWHDLGEQARSWPGTGRRAAAQLSSPRRPRARRAGPRRLHPSRLRPTLRHGGMVSAALRRRLTPPLVPIPGWHAKWLNARRATVATLAGLSALDLLPRNPARLYFTYLDSGHRAADIAGTTASPLATR
jgi:Putative exonuclease SbcCD, C subunit